MRTRPRGLVRDRVFGFERDDVISRGPDADAIPHAVRSRGARRRGDGREELGGSSESLQRSD